MSDNFKDVSLLLVGAGPRLAVAAVIVLLLWAGFFSVTGQTWSTIGAGS